MNIFFISDTHFGHSNILNFKKDDGSPLRVFPSIEDHDEYLIQRWNSTVKVTDKVYHLGDVGFKSFSKLAVTLSRLNGQKILIKGNHDGFKLSQYAQFFKDVRGSHTINKFILSHIPIHPESLARWKGNVHGHLHANKYADSRYINVSVEQLSDYAPISLEDLELKYDSTN